MISSIDRHFRMTGMNEFDSLVARKDAHELDSLASCLLKKRYCRFCANPRCECRVDNNNFPLSNINRQLEVILYRLQCLFVSLKIGTIVKSSAMTGDSNLERGACISTILVGRSLSTSYPINIVISLTISQNSFEPVLTSHR